MRRILLSLAAASLAVPVSFALPAPDAQAKSQKYRGSTTRRQRVCTYSKGKAGLIAGGVGGAIVGGELIGHGLAGPILGAVGGAFAGRAIDRGMTAHRRCRWVYS